MSPEVFYNALTSQPLTDSLRALLGDTACEWFEMGLRGDEFPEARLNRGFDEKSHDHIRTIFQAGKDLHDGTVAYPSATTLINRWTTGGSVVHKPFIFSRHEIREPGVWFPTCALRIDKQIYAAPGALPGVRFPDDTIWMDRAKLGSAASSFKKLRDYKKDNQVQRAKLFGDTLFWAMQLPEQSQLHQLALQGPQAMLRHWFGERYTGALLQSRPAPGSRMNEKDRTWEPAIQRSGTLPVLAKNRFDVTERYLLMPLEEAILFKLQATDSNTYKVWDIGQ